MSDLVVLSQTGKSSYVLIQPLNSELTSKRCGFLECNAEVNLEYLSTGCNPAPNVIDWGHNGLIVFGVCNSVIVYNPTVIF